jgi:hypothetical protein
LTITDDVGETAATIEVKFLNLSLIGGFKTCSSGRYDVFRLKETFGDDTSIADPSLLFIELRLAGVQAFAISRDEQSLIRAEMIVDVIEEPGWYIAGLHESIANTIAFYSADRDRVNWSGARMSSIPGWTFPDLDQDSHEIRWFVECNSQKWTIRQATRDPAEGGERNVTHFESVDPEAAAEVGLRPGVILFEGVRPYSELIEDDGSATPSVDPGAELIDGVGMQIKLHVHGTDTLDFLDPSRTLIAEVDGFAGVGATFLNNVFGEGISPSLSGLGQFDTDVQWPEFFYGARHIDTGTNETVTIQVVIFRGGYRTIQTTPKVRINYTRGLELHVRYTHSPPLLPTVVREEKFVPADGRTFLDDLYDDPIDWINQDGLGTETITTRRGWMVPEDCDDYEERQYPTPVLQRLTWKNETFYLPRTAARRWSRIVDTADGDRLMMVLEYFRTRDPNHNDDEIGWQFLTYHADDLAEGSKNSADR